MIDGLRSMDWVPVSVRQKRGNWKRCMQKLKTDWAGSHRPGDSRCPGYGAFSFQILLKNVNLATLVYLEDFLAGDDQSDRNKELLILSRTTRLKMR